SLYAQYVDHVARAGIDVAKSRRYDAERSTPEPDDRRRGVLVPSPGQRQHRDPLRLRRPDVRQHHDTAHEDDLPAWTDQLLKGKSMDARSSGVSGEGVGGGRTENRCESGK